MALARCCATATTIGPGRWAERHRMEDGRSRMENWSHPRSSILHPLSSLLRWQETRELGAAHRALALQRAPAVVHLLLVRVFDLALGFALHAVGFLRGGMFGHGYGLLLDTIAAGYGLRLHSKTCASRVVIADCRL